MTNDRDIPEQADAALLYVAGLQGAMSNGLSLDEAYKIFEDDLIRTGSFRNHVLAKQAYEYLKNKENKNSR